MRPEDYYIFPSESESEGESTRAFLAKIRSPSPETDPEADEGSTPRRHTVSSERLPERPPKRGDPGDFRPVDNLAAGHLPPNQPSIVFDEDNFFKNQAALRNRSRSSRRTLFPRGATPAPGVLADQEPASESGKGPMPQREGRTVHVGKVEISARENREKGDDTSSRRDASGRADAPSHPSSSKKKHKRAFESRLRRKHLGI